jgi:hypothetical protein
MTVAGLNFNLLSERGEGYRALFGTVTVPGYRALFGTVTVPSVAYAGVTKVCMPLWLPRTGARRPSDRGMYRWRLRSQPSSQVGVTSGE